MKKIDAIELGATLFIPATHKDLISVVEGRKYQNLKSVLVDCEDGINDSNLEKALENVKNLLINFQHGVTLVFLRAKNIDVLKIVLTYSGIDKIDGFILPKFSLLNAKEYLDTIGSKHLFMPSIEGDELFSPAKLFELKEILFPYFKQIITIRFGLEDMLKQLKMKRECKDSVFDIAVTAFVMGSFIATFKSAGFNISGGVFPCFKDNDGFIKDVKRDLKEGLFSKTIIHPNQIDLSNELYKVTKQEFDEALEICESLEQIFNQNGKMAEQSTMIPYAKEIIKRAEVYGIL